MAGFLHLFARKSFQGRAKKMTGQLSVCMAPLRNYLGCVDESAFSAQPAPADHPAETAALEDAPARTSTARRDVNTDTFTQTHAKGRFITNAVVGAVSCGVGHLSGNPLIAMGMTGTLVAMNDFFIGQAHLPGDQVKSDALLGGAFSRWSDVFESASNGSLRYPDHPLWQRAASAVAMGAAHGLACGLASGALLEERSRAWEASETALLFLGTAVAEAFDKSAGLATSAAP